MPSSNDMSPSCPNTFTTNGQGSDKMCLVPFRNTDLETLQAKNINNRCLDHVNIPSILSDKLVGEVGGSPRERKVQRNEFRKQKTVS
jgi:hypothetical protein